MLYIYVGIHTRFEIYIYIYILYRSQFTSHGPSCNRTEQLKITHVWFLSCHVWWNRWVNHQKKHLMVKPPLNHNDWSLNPIKSPCLVSQIPRYPLIVSSHVEKPRCTWLCPHSRRDGIPWSQIPGALGLSCLPINTQMLVLEYAQLHKKHIKTPAPWHDLWM